MSLGTRLIYAKDSNITNTVDLLWCCMSKLNSVWFDWTLISWVKNSHSVLLDFFNWCKIDDVIIYVGLKKIIKNALHNALIASNWTHSSIWSSLWGSWYQIFEIYSVFLVTRKLQQNITLKNGCIDNSKIYIFLLIVYLFTLNECIYFFICCID